MTDPKTRRPLPRGAIVATLVAAAFLGERLTFSQYLGGAMVLGALAAPGILAARGIKAP